MDIGLSLSGLFQGVCAWGVLTCGLVRQERSDREFKRSSSQRMPVVNYFPEFVSKSFLAFVHLRLSNVLYLLHPSKLRNRFHLENVRFLCSILHYTFYHRVASCTYFRRLICLYSFFIAADEGSGGVVRRSFETWPSRYRSYGSMIACTNTAE